MPRKLPTTEAVFVASVLSVYGNAHALPSRMTSIGAHNSTPDARSTFASTLTETISFSGRSIGFLAQNRSFRCKLALLLLLVEPERRGARLHHEVPFGALDLGDHGQRRQCSV